MIFDFRRKEHYRRPVASPTTPLLCTKCGKTLSDHVFRDPKGNTLCISCLPEHLQESAYRYTESLDMLAAGPEREAGDGTPLRSAICSLAPASSERHPRFHMHFTPTSGSGSLRT